MSDQLLEDIFNTNFWRGYKIHWCDMCDTHVISCKECKNSSCNGGGCDKCDKDFDDFMALKPYPIHYLTAQEVDVVRKYWAIKRLLPISIAQGYESFDPKELREHMSIREEEIFGLKDVQKL